MLFLVKELSRVWKAREEYFAHIDYECVTGEMLKDFLGSELGEDWVDLSIELKFKELSKKVAERAISNDDAELFTLIENQN